MGEDEGGDTAPDVVFLLLGDLGESRAHGLARLEDRLPVALRDLAGFGQEVGAVLDDRAGGEQQDGQKSGGEDDHLGVYSSAASELAELAFLHELLDLGGGDLDLEHLVHPDEAHVLVLGPVAFLDLLVESFAGQRHFVRRGLGFEPLARRPSG